ncbi:hypothetical protein C5B42_04805 [Candidatus Cerribacteria bacterium 'Amazon FNV 2010 28 9']|uniref:GIY-YIG domain-containing protein n=1 Tax=Candidatus Cerribacteria bacterium 'Amazon FNV 2010 28 9' TaxID=2081795 RepID=A0A317JSR4_9BACT|nr:MAG: hypothetical protein C5B42_04805 [Candidatus Cerribacteria bacterium 'Amazon FNV 2010 28 9']
MFYRQYYVYILSNQRHTVYYVGVTNDLIKRVWEHKNKLANGFTKKYNVDQLVWFDVTNDVEGAISSEKRIKRWKRSWKENIIKEKNPLFEDLYTSIVHS